MLVSRDEQSCLVVSYREIKSCIETAFGCALCRNGSLYVIDGCAVSCLHHSGHYVERELRNAKPLIGQNSLESEKDSEKNKTVFFFRPRRHGVFVTLMGEVRFPTYSRG